MGNDRPDHLLVLWDIDHTLIETRGLGGELYRAAFEEITGRPMEQAADVTGKTEPAILAETLRLHGIEPTDDLQRRYAEALTGQYRQHVDQLRERGRALPGAHAALAALAEETGVIQTVLTGNLRAVAAIKLETFGLTDHLDLDSGAYGDDDRHRPALVAIAQRRAASRHCRIFSRANTVVVGDSSQDVLTARDGGAGIVAVAGSLDIARSLREAGATVVLTGLIRIQEVVLAVTRSVGPELGNH